MFGLLGLHSGAGSEEYSANWPTDPCTIIMTRIAIFRQVIRSSGPRARKLPTAYPLAQYAFDIFTQWVIGLSSCA